MITPDWARMMARYNAWQNGSLYGAADGLTDAARREDRGAFWGSIHGTLSHLLWGDTVWMNRLAGWPKPEAGIRETATWVDDWDELKARRQETDAGIADWASGLSAADLEGGLTWWSGATGREVTKAHDELVTHFFNHQTHHRGQVHAMLTAAGARPDDTDLIFMPDA